VKTIVGCRREIKSHGLTSSKGEFKLFVLLVPAKSDPFVILTVKDNCSAITLCSRLAPNPDIFCGHWNPKIQLDDKTGLGFNVRL
jgi:hypothetical protein